MRARAQLRRPCLQFHLSIFSRSFLPSNSCHISVRYVVLGHTAFNLVILIMSDCKSWLS